MLSISMSRIKANLICMKFNRTMKTLLYENRVLYLCLVKSYYYNSCYLSYGLLMGLISCTMITCICMCI